MEWLLSQYSASTTSFMEAAESIGPNGAPVWEFRIAKPRVLASLLSGGGFTPAARLKEDEVEACEEFLVGVLWAISTFANGIVPSYLTACRAKASTWMLVEYLRQQPARAQALHVAYSSDAALPLCPLAVAACVLPWREPAMTLLGDIGPSVLGLVQAEFPDLFDFEAEHDAKQLRWVREKKWVEGGYVETPEGLAFRDLEAFDAKVKDLANEEGLLHKTIFSDCVRVQDGDCLFLPTRGRSMSSPPAKRMRLERFDAVARPDDALDRDPNEPADGDSPYDDAGLAEALAAAICEADDALPECGAPSRPGAEAQDPSSVAVGAQVEGYWPEDDTWLPAVVAEARPDGVLRIVWSVDASESVVPVSYVREVVGATL